MASIKLTDRVVRHLKTDKAQQEITDEGFPDGSFGIRVSRNGRKVFMLRYRVQRRRQRRTLGSYPGLSLAEARSRARTLLAQVQLGQDPVQQASEAAKEQRVPTLAVYYREFKKVYIENPGAVRNSTRDHYRWAFGKHIMKSRLASKPMDQISKGDLEKYVAQLVKKGYAKDTVDGIVRALRKIFNRALDEELISKSPVKKLRDFYRQAPVKNMDVLPYDHEESERFLETAHRLYPDDFYFLFLTALHTGLRSGELKALQWDDLDLENKRLEVRRNHSHGQMNSPKTKRGRRMVDLSDHLASELVRWRSRLQETWLAKGQNRIPQWVFPNEAGNMMDFHNLKNRQYKRVIRKAKLRYIPFHCLRDTFATLLLMSNTSISYISEQLGHKDPTVTVEHYARWLPGSNQAAMMFCRMLPETGNPWTGLGLGDPVRIELNAREGCGLIQGASWTLHTPADSSAEKGLDLGRCG